MGQRSCVFMGDEGMLLGNGKLLPEDKFIDFKPPAATASVAGALGRMGQLRQRARSRARLQLPVRAGRPKQTTLAT